MKKWNKPQLLGSLGAITACLFAACDSAPSESSPSAGTSQSQAALPSGIPGLMPSPNSTPSLSMSIPQEELPPPAASLPPAPTPSAPVLAPEGVYFTMEPISVTHSSGVSGITPGTRVRLVRRQETTMVVTDGKNQFEVTPDQVTNDTTIAQNLLQRDQSAQSSLAELQARQKEALRQQEAQRRLAFERHVNQVIEEKQEKEEAQASANANKPKYESPLDRGAYNQTRVWRYDIYGRSYWVDIYGRRHYVYRYGR